MCKACCVREDNTLQIIISSLLSFLQSFLCFPIPIICDLLKVHRSQTCPRLGLPWSLASSPASQIHRPSSSNYTRPPPPSLTQSPQQHSLPFHSLHPRLPLPRISILSPKSQTQPPSTTSFAPCPHKPCTHTHLPTFAPHPLRKRHPRPHAPSPLSHTSSAPFPHRHSSTVPAVTSHSLNFPTLTPPAEFPMTTRAPLSTVRPMRPYGAAAGGALKEQEIWVPLMGGAMREGTRWVFVL
jgi:hypothetical protein